MQKKFPLILLLLAAITLSGGLILAEASAAEKAYKEGVALYDTDPDGAIARFKAAMQADAAYGPAYVMLAQAYWEKKNDIQTAVNYCDQIIAQKPNWYPPYLLEGKILLNAPSLDLRNMAGSYFIKAFDLMPNDKTYDGDRVIALIGIGTAQRRAGRYAESIQALETAIGFDARNLLALNQLGLTYIAKTDYEKARSYYQKAVEIDPKYAPAWYNIACSHALEKNVEKAVENLGKAIGLDQSYRDKAKLDSDFDSIKNEKAFKDLING